MKAAATPAIALAAALAACGPGVAGEPSATLEQALLVEWMVANCDHAAIPAITAGAAMMIINGQADPARVPAIRERIRAGMREHYPSPEVGCAALAPGMGISPPHNHPPG